MRGALALTARAQAMSFWSMSLQSYADTSRSDQQPDHMSAVLANIRARIDAAARRAGRDPQTVTLVAVSKTHGPDAVAAARRAGQSVFGENKVQEALSKFLPLRDEADPPTLHLIGGLQTNKARDAVRVADVIESLDRPRLADALALAAEKEKRLPRLLVQVNVGDEPQKSGIPTREADSFIEMCRHRFGDALCGVMGIPPADVDPQPYFSWLAAAAARHGLPVISMGMSGDFEQAIANGATHVRIGTAIFGARPRPSAAEHSSPSAPDGGHL
ncbi:putative exported protein [Granulibacter bethesdensis]|uniref:Pyridoxal phosphate homeostasis protein n=2 Tax=Granulibacter bethesdensis TaxID=364410 RepID=A0AAC9KEJ4_9PROT|nr:putative exported protein [Granulibacter bethesdensis]APH63257.1 putative exported protein [Granulibacter bethesdensis]